jgi:NHLM bacteriocin system secretion protein
VSRQIFRKAAIERLSSPEQLDTLTHIVSGKGWLALLAMGLLIISGAVWGIWGSISEKVYGQGILLKSSGIFNVISQSNGTVNEVYVEVDDVIKSGQIVARVSQFDILDTIKETKAQLQELQKQRETLVQYGSENLKLENELMLKTRDDLEKANTHLRKQMKWLKERAQNREQLVTKGLITRQTLLETLQQIDQMEEQINDNDSKYQQTFMDELDLQNQRTQEILNIDQSIGSANEQLGSLQHQLEINSKISSPYSGRVLEVTSERGRSVNVGDPIVQIEIADGEIEDLKAVFYVNAEDGSKVLSGMLAEVSPSTVKQEEYGFMLGIVTNVSKYPATTQGMYRVLQNDALVQAMSAGGVPIEINAILIPDPGTTSGYHWSSAKGPPVEIHSGIVCTVGVTVRKVRPLELVIPLFKKHVLGVGADQAIGGSGL